ncbi:hypothetical protein GA0116948_11036 [Chitinophaga costaii]|uniref:Uncharacterized protein n=1 Tax=Chitinophaga costaii TaxID=1335309 RepID=A0A1C4EVR3_9BACT|nr:DUF6520 family protein [Chitinophaga costaii]SCC47611.1 hypothetical protein GA0116948_11036 [Chitinophaga costaii]
MKKLKISLAAVAIALSVSAAFTTSKAASYRVSNYGVVAISGSYTYLKGEVVGGVHQPADLSTKTNLDYSCSDASTTCTVTITGTPVEVGTTNEWRILTSQTSVNSDGEFTAITF